MEATETIEEWAARMAPLLTVDDWRYFRLVAAGFVFLSIGAVSADQARALLGRRVEVATSLDPSERRALFMVRDGHRSRRTTTGQRRARQRLDALGLTRVDHWRVITDFGREIARYLSADDA